MRRQSGEGGRPHGGDHIGANPCARGLRAATRRAKSDAFFPFPAAFPDVENAMLKALLLCCLILSPAVALAQGWALGGMDAVAYRSQGDAVPGETDISTQWAGKEWHFASEENRAAFEANPRAFAPGLNGLCPVALAEGRVVEGNPRYFAVVGQRLYLLESEPSRRQFTRDPREWLMRAKAAFVKLSR